MKTDTIADAMAAVNLRVEDRPPTFTPLRIGADGSRIAYDGPPSFAQLRSDLLGGIAIVVMNGVNLPALYAEHAMEDDPTAGYDNAQAELLCLLESAVDTDPDLAKLWLDMWCDEVEGLCLGETANGEPMLMAAVILDPPPSISVQVAVVKTKEEALASILAKKKARNQVHVNKRLVGALLTAMAEEHPDRVYAKTDFEVFAELAGISYLAASPALAFMVAEGLIERVRQGLYRVPRAERTEAEA